MKIEYIRGRKTLDFANFRVQQRKENYFGIYLRREGKLLTHTTTWKRATKIASLLEEAFHMGYCEAKNMYDFYTGFDEDDYYYDDYEED